MIKLVIFDYDGLMVNSEEVIFAALRTLFRRYDIDLQWDYFKTLIGVPVDVALPNLYKKYPLSISFEAFVHERNILVEEYLRDKLELVPYVKKFLEMLREKKISIALATSGRRTHIVYGFQKFGLTSFFEAVVTIDDVKRGKPYPDLILRVLELTHVKPSEVILIEDSPNGIEAAFRAGIRSVAVPTKGMDLSDFSKANKVFFSFKDLYENLDFFLKE